MSNTNGDGGRKIEADIVIQHIKLETVFLACLVSLLQVTKEASMSHIEADAIVFSCATLDQALDTMDEELVERWSQGVVRCVHEDGPGVEVKP